MTATSTWTTQPERPVRNAFGSRIDMQVVLNGLVECGLFSARLVLRDQTLILEHARRVPTDPTIMRAVTFLRDLFSPLMAIQTQKSDFAPKTGFECEDQRSNVERRLALVEWRIDLSDLASAARTLFPRNTGSINPGPAQLLPCPANPTAHQQAIAQALGTALGAHGYTTDRTRIVWLESSTRGAQILAEFLQESPDLNVFILHRPETRRGFRPAYVAGATTDAASFDWFVSQLSEHDSSAPAGLLLDGLAWEIGRRPVIAHAPTTNSQERINRDVSLCTDCGICGQLCPVSILDASGRLRRGATWAECLSCMDCVEACEADALRPVYSDSSATIATLTESRPGWLSRLAGLPGPAIPAPTPPSYFLPKPSRGATRVVLGLSICTMQEHAAVLLVDGKIIGAIEEERLNRVRHYGWQPDTRPGVTLAVDPTLAIEEAVANRSVRVLLEHAGLTRDDLDAIAINGLPARYRRVRSLLDHTTPLPMLRSGRLVFTPHHLAHAASSALVSGQKDGHVFTVDGRGDRETAAFFTLENGRLQPKKELLSLTDQSIGGVYETITRLLGFGSHGQGSVMALACFGQPEFDLSAFLSARGFDDVSIHESGLEDTFVACRRPKDSPLSGNHRNLAASLQSALETCVEALLKDAGLSDKTDLLCLAGGVTLNCQMNQFLRKRFGVDRLVIQPAANDAGTALGAALLAWKRANPDSPLPTLDHVYWGPDFDEEAIQATLEKHGLAFEKPDDIAAHTTRRIADGKIVCWFSGRMEFGPRALGSRSIVADPRSAAIKDHVNRLKQRETWRPFGPSILAGHETEWFADGFDSRFMLVTADVRPDKRPLIPAVLHVDGSTRPQSVHAQTHPEYHRLISEFHALTGVPMILNTSFNRRGEPIVCTPEDAVGAFLAMKADALAIGPFFIEHPGDQPKPSVRSAIPDVASIRALSGGRRLSLRITTDCDCRCAHCTLADIPERGVRSMDDILPRLARGRENGCNELVLMRGEPLGHPDILAILKSAREMGYDYIQAQTNAHRLADPDFRNHAIVAGLNGADIILWAADPALHDRLSGRPGTARDALLAIRALISAGCFVLVNIPVIRDNLHELPKLVALCKKLGVTRIQFTFPRPLETPERIVFTRLLRLEDAAVSIGGAAELARRAGLIVSTEGLPLCLLPDWLHGTPDSDQDWRRHRIDDLHILHESLNDERKRARPLAPVCRTCAKRDACPTTWALYQEIFGSGEFKPFTE